MSALEDEVLAARTWWGAAVERRDERIMLRPQPGARRVVTSRRTGLVFDEQWLPTERLEAAVGDCLLMVGAGDELAFVTVDRAEPGVLHVVVNAGAIAPSTDRAQLLQANGLRQPRKKNRSRRRLPRALAREATP